MNEKAGNAKAPFPNTFLIGVQKAGTTTLNDWLSQHPQVYGYASLKDIPLFVKFPSSQQLNKRLSLETPPYDGQHIILHSAVNYIFYSPLLQKISDTKADAKLLLILRNPVYRAISSYFYFQKMLREKRDIEKALLYQPKKDFEINRDNNDFTYIEHGFYYEQIKNCLQYFSKQQLLILDYEDMKDRPQELLKDIFHFLNIDESFQPDLMLKNVTGDLKSRFLQEKILKKNKSRKWIVDHLIDPWLPVNKRKLLKNKIFELNTSKQKQPIASLTVTEETMKKIQNCLQEIYLHDTAQLDELLGTNFFAKWFGHEVIPNK
jgi:hypothetical protein